MIRQNTLIVMLALTLLGCASIAPGSDPVVVNAERTTTLALEVFDAFLSWEYTNREVLSSRPEIKKVADVIRRDGINWLETSRRLTKAYKANRNDQNKANLETAVSVLSAALSEVRIYYKP